MNSPDVASFFDPVTNNITHVVADPETGACAIIDSLLDFDLSTGRTAMTSADKVIEHVVVSGLTLEWIIDTHIHADHVTAAPYLRSKLGGKIATGHRITEIQAIFGKLFNVEADFHYDGSQFDHLFADNEVYRIGSLEARAIATPGHTPACMTHIVGDAAFVGDTLFMPDYGTARCDFPGGDAHALFHSIQRIYELPDDTRIFLNHDYLPKGREECAWQTSVGDQRRINIHLRDGVDEAEFVAMRTKRDAKLAPPRLMVPSVQVNMRAGEFPHAESNGTRYIKVPVDVL